MAEDYARIGFSIYGLSTQETAYQNEAVERLHLPYPLLSDAGMELGKQLGLDHFAYEGNALYKRCTLVVLDGVILQAHLDIADPASHPHDLLESLDSAR